MPTERSTPANGENGDPHGKGKYVYADGRIQQGEWKYGKPVISDEEETNKRPGRWDEGIHTFVFNNGDKYTGQWKYGKPHGQGTMVYENGNTYIGRMEERSVPRPGNLRSRQKISLGREQV